VSGALGKRMHRATRRHVCGDTEAKRAGTARVFALILPALLMVVLSIIEGALLFQSYIAVQHAAREAARYAVTYMPRSRTAKRRLC